MSTALPQLPRDRAGVVEWVRDHLGHLTCDTPEASPAFTGGQSAADAALAALDISGYARRRSMVHPPSARGASKLSPYIRHGLLDLPTVWQHVEDAPSNDRFKYQSELLWQEFARHWYAVFGTATRDPLNFEPPRAEQAWPREPWSRDLQCIDETLQELYRDGWCVNQTRMWLAGHYSLRGHGDPSIGENAMFRHLLDGSRAANRMGWQWSAGTSRSRAYNFTRRLVMKRAPAYCKRCELQDDCPIRAYAKPLPRGKVPAPEPHPPTAVFGPTEATEPLEKPSHVWLTAESLGTNDPALAAHPELPALFVFDEPLLQRLQLSGKRLIFLAETLAELQTHRDLALYLGRPGTLLADKHVAVTFAPVPGFAPRSQSAASVQLHPWPWLRPLTARLDEHVTRAGSMPYFKEWCQLTKPSL